MNSLLKLTPTEFCAAAQGEVERITKEPNNQFDSVITDNMRLNKELAALRDALRNCAFAASAGNTEQIAGIGESALANPFKEIE